jgi:hypothetical protein
VVKQFSTFASAGAGPAAGGSGVGSAPGCGGGGFT